MALSLQHISALVVLARGLISEACCSFAGHTVLEGAMMKANGSEPKKISRDLMFFAVLLAALLVCAWARVERVPLARDAHTEPGLTSHKVHYGTATGSHTSGLDVHRVGLQLAEPAVGTGDAAAFDQFSAPIARSINGYTPPTPSYRVSKFSDFIDMFLQRFEINDTLSGAQGV
jgi:hypothetical protein